MIGKIRIVELVSSLRIGGAEKQVVYLMNNLSTESFEKDLICLWKVETPFLNMLKDGVSPRYIDVKESGFKGFCSRVYKLYKTLASIRPHVLHCHMFQANLYGTIAGKLAKVPVIVTTEHGKNPWKTRKHVWIERHIITTLATVRVGVSEDIKKLRISRGEVTPHKIVVIPNGVEMPNITKNYLGRLTKIGAIGRLIEAKDYGTLIRGFALAVKNGFDGELCFIGDGPERQMLQDLASRYNVEQKVHFVGFQSNMEKWFTNLDLVVFTSIREGIPVAMLEAMAHGIPIIATPVGGIPEVIRNEIDGILIKVGDAEALAEAIKRLTLSNGLRERIGVNGQKRVEELFSVRLMCKRYEELFQQKLFEKGINVIKP